MRSLSHLGNGTLPRYSVALALLKARSLDLSLLVDARS
jgi:hypothetical protein